MHVLPPGAPESARVRARQVLSDAINGTRYEHFEQILVEGADVAETILNCSKGACEHEPAELIVIGATNEPLFRNLLVGNLIESIAREAEVTVIVVKRRSSPLHSFLRQTVLEPSSNTVK